MLSLKPRPHVSVLMPTFKHAAFIRRALESLRAQTLTDWELIIVDDGSPDETGVVVAPYLLDERIHYIRLERNQGLGAALNVATGQAQGRYVAYLPSDDVFYPDHLARLAKALDQSPEVHLVYGGVRWGYKHQGPTLQGEGAVGRERAALDEGNVLTLVQTMHRHEPGLVSRWPTRAERESDSLACDFWRAMLDAGAGFAYAGSITCEWVAHADQRHKLILPPGGLARYRQYYGLGAGEFVNWQPSRGPRLDERERFGRFKSPSQLPGPDGLRILLVGSLGFNPERIMAFEERGHKLYGLWLPEPESWDTTGPLPFGSIETIPFDGHWQARVRAARPDVVYALLNWQALPFITAVFDAGLNVPIVFHFKEGPFICHEKRLWPQLIRLLTESDGRVLISPENLAWFQLATDGELDPETTCILDGDLPKQDWLTASWSPKLSDQDGEIHTVCTGRPLGLDPFDDIARAKIHVHFYGSHFHELFPNWTRAGLATGYMHIHPTVEPADWTSELSQYDAAWFHVFESDNRGDLRRAHWDDLNLPARMGTYAAAGLPWILKDNRHSRVAIQSLAEQNDVGVFFTDFADLAAQLSDRRRVARMTANMRAARHEFAFDTHVDGLIQFFRRIIHTRVYTRWL